MSEKTIPYPANSDEAKALVESLGREFDLDLILISRDRIEEIVSEPPAHVFSFDHEELDFFRRVEKHLVDQIMTDQSTAVDAAQIAMVDELRELLTWHRDRLRTSNWKVRLFVPGNVGDPALPENQELVATVSTVKTAFIDGFADAFDADAWGRAALGKHPSDLRNGENVNMVIESPSMGSMPVVRYELIHTSANFFPETLILTPEQ